MTNFGMSIHHHGPYNFRALNMTPRFNTWGGHSGSGIFMGYQPGGTNTVINNFYGNYGYMGGMYNFNNWMPPRPPMSRFDRFMAGLGRVLKQAAPIAAGVAAFSALFKKDDAKPEETETEDPAKIEEQDRQKYNELIGQDRNTLSEEDKKELERLEQKYPAWKQETENRVLQDKIDELEQRITDNTPTAEEREKTEMLDLLAKRNAGQVLSPEDEAKLNAWLEKNPGYKPQTNNVVNEPPVTNNGSKPKTGNVGAPKAKTAEQIEKEEKDDFIYLNGQLMLGKTLSEKDKKRLDEIRAKHPDWDFDPTTGNMKIKSQKPVDKTQADNNVSNTADNTNGKTVNTRIRFNLSQKLSRSQFTKWMGTATVTVDGKQYTIEMPKDVAIHDLTEARTSLARRMSVLLAMNGYDNISFTGIDNFSYNNKDDVAFDPQLAQAKKKAVQ